MIKPCIFLNGQLINIGEWDHQFEQVEVTPAEYDEEGNEVTPAEFEDVITNPLPDGATIEEREVTYSEDHGWRLIDAPIPKSQTEQLQDQVNELTILLGDVLLGGDPL